LSRIISFIGWTEIMLEPRIARLKEQLLTSPYEVCIERAKFYTEAYKQHEQEPIIIKRARALQNTLEKQTIFIRDDEILVGAETSKNLGEKIALDLYSFRDFTKQKHVDHIRSRKVQPFQIDQAEFEELQQYLPYWRDKSLYDTRIFGRMARENLIENPSRREAYTPNVAIMTGTNEGHICFGYEKVLNLGYKGIIQEATTCQDKLDRNDPEFEKKFNFYEAVKIYYEAGIRFARCHAQLADELATNAADPAEKNRLKLIAETLNRVPENPAGTFHEAIQSIWFTQNIVNIICYRSVLALGRLDQILWHYYEKDRQENKLTQEFALELIEELNLKLTWNSTMLQDEYSMASNALGLNTQTITIGGLKKDGTDGTNELSYLFLEAQRKLRVATSDLSVRIHPNTPREFFFEAIRVFQETSGIAFYNDDVIIRALQKSGYSLEDARNYVIIGCVEPTSQANTIACTGAMFINLPGVLELVLNNGYSQFSNRLNGLQTGDPATFRTFDDFLDAFKQQLRFNIEQSVKIANIWDEEASIHYEQPFISATIDNCMEQGKDITRGGAKYNFSSITAYGFATLVDSLYNIKKFVYDDQLITISELVEVLNSNFKGRRELRQQLINKYEKWGNDQEEIDEFARQIWGLFCTEVVKHETFRGGRFNPGAYSMGIHVLMGLLLNATPDGRKRAEPISNSLSPVNRVGKKGVTAILKSVAKLDYDLAINGIALNVRFHPLSVQSNEKVEKFHALLKTYFELGGMQVQPNVVSTDTLKDAQKHPENYPDLIVKVGGYNALFVDLGSSIQRDIIKRLEHQL